MENPVDAPYIVISGHVPNVADALFLFECRWDARRAQLAASYRELFQIARQKDSEMAPKGYDKRISGLHELRFWDASVRVVDFSRIKKFEDQPELHDKLLDGQAICVNEPLCSDRSQYEMKDLSFLVVQADGFFWDGRLSDSGWSVESHMIYDDILEDFGE
jgi:hypothetical protein